MSLNCVLYCVLAMISPASNVFQATGLGGKPTLGHDTSKVETMKPVEDRIITVRFNADVHSSMRWNFKPQQIQVKVIMFCVCDRNIIEIMVMMNILAYAVENFPSLL